MVRGAMSALGELGCWLRVRHTFGSSSDAKSGRCDQEHGVMVTMQIITINNNDHLAIQRCSSLDEQTKTAPQCIHKNNWSQMSYKGFTYGRSGAFSKKISLERVHHHLPCDLPHIPQNRRKTWEKQGQRAAARI